MRRVEPAITAAARRVDPTALLREHGFLVLRPNNGRHIYVRDSQEEVLRITQQSDGHYVACDKFGKPIGDNIALLQLIKPGTAFRTAVERLVCLAPGELSRETSESADWVNCPLPKLPPRTRFAECAGRAYLATRGIDPSVTASAEGQGFVSYVADGILFLGRSADGTVRWISKRFLPGHCAPRGEVKRDFVNSQKRFAAILYGTTDEVFVVEGGMDALAAHCRANRSGIPAPTVIVTGGSRCITWIHEKHIAQLLRKAKRITVVYENEIDKDGEVDREKQTCTDRDHDKQVDRIKLCSSGEVARWRPPHFVKDLADLNQMECAREKMS